jgi:uncharacterized protein YoxC
MGILTVFMILALLALMVMCVHVNLELNAVEKNLNRIVEGIKNYYEPGRIDTSGKPGGA